MRSASARRATVSWSASRTSQSVSGRKGGRRTLSFRVVEELRLARVVGRAEFAELSTSDSYLSLEILLTEGARLVRNSGEPGGREGTNRSS